MVRKIGPRRVNHQAEPFLGHEKPGAFMNDTTMNDDAWFYAQGGQRNGPVPADKLRELLAAQLILFRGAQAL